ncbi:hypothetical protein F7734_09195 [Scytonema sp. UIC 10036]|uniref:hypothetical protein n=1 Tax=Scytonema sp. UIC 10036 TaxID=2304196 RepID=UPI0012DA3B27|nr:hypothetical protein [Scytonema sp. UIC 10036]MUG92619.1 hypothetical protein [Scytonema sp. UIC 10036]
MQMRNEFWQGYFGYWQNRFIHHNILTIGYTAWNGYLNAGKGMVVCDVVDAIPTAIDWSVDTVSFNRAFIPQAQVTLYLQALELEKDAVTALHKAIATYDPTQEMVILLVGNGAVDINLLQNLAISPAECYKQVQQRWAEFYPDLTA